MTVPLHSPPLHLISNVFGRKHQSLNGDWHTIVDPYENGYYDYRYEPLAEPYGRNKKPTSVSDRIEYDFDQSPTLKVPGDWNSQRLELSLYEGTVWYKTSFVAERARGRRQFLHLFRHGSPQLWEARREGASRLATTSPNGPLSEPPASRVCALRESSGNQYRQGSEGSEQVFHIG